MLQRYLLITIAGVLVAVVSYLIYKYLKLQGRKGVDMRREDVVGRLFIRKINKLNEEAGKEKLPVMFKKLNGIMRSFFSELLEIKYEFAHLELNEELSKLGIGDDVKNEVINYTMDMSEAEYGGHEIDKEKFQVLLEKSVQIVGKLTEYVEGVPEKAQEKEPPGGEKPKEKEEAPVPEKKVTEKDILIPTDEKERIPKLRKLLLEAEGNLKKKRAEDAMENYSELRELYDSLSPETKRKINSETKRVIAVYNSLVKEYSETLSSKE